jgi:hypothetical protein
MPWQPGPDGGDGVPRGVINSVRICLRKYDGVSGRAPRAEYWWFTLANVLVQLVTRVLARHQSVRVVDVAACGVSGRDDHPDGVVQDRVTPVAEGGTRFGRDDHPDRVVLRSRHARAQPVRAGEWRPLICGRWA